MLIIVAMLCEKVRATVVVFVNPLLILDATPAQLNRPDDSPVVFPVEGRKGMENIRNDSTRILKCSL